MTTQRETFNFTHAEIKKIPVDSAGLITLLPAPGVGKMYRLIDSLWVLNTTAGAYTPGFGANWAINYGSPGTLPVVAASVYTPMEEILGRADRSFIRLTPAVYAPGTNGNSPSLEGLCRGVSGLITQVENKPLILEDNQATYSGGDAGNTLVGWLEYTIEDI